LPLHSLTAKIGFSVGCGACQCAKCALGVSSCYFVSNQGKSVNRSDFVTLLQVVGNMARGGLRVISYQDTKNVEAGYRSLHATETLNGYIVCWQQLIFQL